MATQIEPQEIPEEELEHMGQGELPDKLEIEEALKKVAEIIEDEENGGTS